MSKTIALIAFLAALSIAFLFLPTRDWFMWSEDYVRSLGNAGPIIMVVVYIVGAVFLVPGSAMTLGIASFFRPKTAFTVVLFGANGGALCAFILARTFFREKVVRWAEANPRFHLFDQDIGRQGFKMVLLARLSPIFPFNTLNYLLGVTPVKTGAYVLANLVGMLPGMILYVYIGVAARDALVEQADAGFFQQILKYGGLLATVAVVVVVTRIARKALREVEQQREKA
ncbi:MAG TPA: TVP38/TMEM64 family protein [Methylomirabilota bacterium]|nr:TVP38/TMEM64 family protein [Methylomirabilota bacterium]